MSGPIPEIEAKLVDLGVSRESLQRLTAYIEILLHWQSKVNLIGPATVQDIWRRHVLDSAQLLPFIAPDTKRLAELGSGAGIPGLILGILLGLEVHLYESNAKKCAFLREAARITSTNAVIHNIRLETLSRTNALPHVSCVVARALAPLPLLLSYAEPFLKTGAIGLFHKGQDVDNELTEATKCWKMRFMRHQSIVESNSVILEVKEAIHV